MNERIKELAEQARKYARDYVAECKHYGHYMEHNEYDLRFEGKFAELLIRECAEVADNADAMRQKWEGIGKYVKEHFGVEENKGWVCPRCGVDRTKNVCPQGYTATIEGKCPMIGVAQ